jgi:hypothetical protein
MARANQCGFCQQRACFLQIVTQRNSVTAQIAHYFAQEQGESTEFAGINAHFQHSYWAT